jgi:hypothetical protein
MVFQRFFASPASAQQGGEVLVAAMLSPAGGGRVDLCILHVAIGAMVQEKLDRLSVAVQGSVM